MMNLATCLGLSLYRFCQRAFYGPTTENPTVQRLIFDSNFGSPSGKTHCISHVRYQSVSASVPSLLFCGSPTTIPRLVAFRAIDSVVAVRFGWFLAHIGVEVLERFLPSLAYCNAVSAVVRKGFHVLVVAALLHCLPRSVFWRVNHTVLSFTACLAAMAIFPERGSLDRFFGSAGASTQPIGSFRWVIDGFFDYRPFTELLPSQVFEIGSATSRIRFRHAKSPIQVSLVKVQRELQLLSVPFHFSSLMLRGQR